jgi:hypothetical protein
VSLRGLTVELVCLVLLESRALFGIHLDASPLELNIPTFVPSVMQY